MKSCHISLRFLLILGMKTAPFTSQMDRWIFCNFLVLFSGKIGLVSPICEVGHYEIRGRTGRYKMLCSGIISAHFYRS